MTFCSPAFSEFSPVPVLLGSCRPNTVLRSVILIIVDAFKSHLGIWPLTHIVKEKLERFTPSFANFYASFPVAVVSQIVGVFTPPYHRTPSVIFCCPGSTMRDRSDSNLLQIQASARARMPITQGSLIDYFCRSAFAFAEPSLMIFSRFGLRKHCQPSVFLSDEIHALNCIRGNDRRVKP